MEAEAWRPKLGFARTVLFAPRARVFIELAVTVRVTRAMRGVLAVRPRRSVNAFQWRASRPPAPKAMWDCTDPRAEAQSASHVILGLGGTVYPSWVHALGAQTQGFTLIGWHVRRDSLTRATFRKVG